MVGTGPRKKKKGDAEPSAVAKRNREFIDAAHFAIFRQKRHTGLDRGRDDIGCLAEDAQAAEMQQMVAVDVDVGNDDNIPPVLDDDDDVEPEPEYWLQCSRKGVQGRSPRSDRRAARVLHQSSRPTVSLSVRFTELRQVSNGGMGSGGTGRAGMGGWHGHGQDW